MFKQLYPASFTVLLAILLGTAQGQQQNHPAAGNPVTPVVNTTPGPYSGNLKVSYVRTWEARTPLNTINDITGASYQDARQTTQYVDGLGRPLQTVVRQITPAAKDIVSPVIYDEFDREVYTYLSYASSDDNGLFKTDPFNAQKQFMLPQYNNEEAVFYKKNVYEASPLKRVVKAMAPGNSWAGSDRGVQINYMVNAADDAVRIWKIAGNALTYTSNNKDASINVPFNPALVVYNAGELYKNVTVDEAGNAVVEYVDKEGQVILKKVQVGTITAPSTLPSGLQADLTITGTGITGLYQAYNSITVQPEFESGNDFTAEIATGTSAYGGYNGFLCTYYVYDDLNQLRFVIPPKAVAQLIANNWQFTDDIVNELCYRYEYDNKKRLIGKKLPGADWVYMVYDARNRLVFTQDGNQRLQGQWMTTLYDGLNRPVMTGMVNWNSGTPAALQQSVTAQTINAGETSVDGVLIYKNPIPAGAAFTALTKAYYDNYAWTNKTFNATYNGLLDAGSNAHPVAMPVNAHMQTTDLVTGAQVRMITDPGNLAAGNWLTTVNFYDDQSRLIQTNSETHKGTDITTNRYDFTDNLICSYLDHTNPTGTPTSVHVKTNLEYDFAGRLKEIWKTLNDDASKKALIASNNYNELGQLVNKKLGRKKDLSGAYTSNELESLDYSYNIRGWMTGINKDFANNIGTSSAWFGMELNYDKGFQVSQYNGNIAGTKWRSRGDGAQRAYGYTYDMANRLLGADFTQYDNGGYIDHPTIQFDLQMGDGINTSTAYDENGNILALKQSGLLLNSSQIIDNLVYTYFKNGNKAKTVTDNSSPQSQAKLGDFADNNTNGNDYGYDLNGNVITDKNKKLGSVSNVADVDQTNGAITYNHMNLPWKIKVTDGVDKGTITYVYDAAGNKLQKITWEKSATVSYNNNSYTTEITTTTNYVGGFIYESKAYLNNSLVSLGYADKLQLINHEEGRIRYIEATQNTAAHYEYDYFVKDNLGNVRVMLTEERKQDVYPAATLEGDPAVSTDAAYIEKQFYSFNSTYVRDIVTNPITGLSAYQNNNGNPPYNNNPNSNTAANSTKVYQLNASTNKTGLSTTLKVMAGDQINIYGKSYWFNSGGNYNQKYDIPVSGILDAFLSSPAMVGKGLTTTGITTAGLTDALNLFRTRTDNADAPWAYINWIFFDEQFNYAGGGFDRVASLGGLKNHDNTTIPTLTAPKNGYIFVYCSNESQYNVYFDNLQVIHSRGALMEEFHYYPWGLTMAGISSRAINVLQNKFQFLDREKQSAEFSDGSGLDMYDLSARFYDPQTGRFGQIDPLAEYMRRWSPYAYGFDNPVRFADKDGMTPKDSTLKTEFFLNPSGTVAVQTMATVEVVGHKKSSPNLKSWIHGFFDVVGMIDPTGLADGLNAVMYLAEGNYKEAALSAISMIPLGDIAKGLKYVDEAEEVIEDVIKYEDEVVEVAEKNFAEHAVSKGCGCFLAGTLVLTDSSYKPIEKIKPGDKVWAYNDTTHTYSLKQVVRLFQYVRDTVYQLHIGSEVISTTSDHPFFIGGRWLRVKELHVGDSITTYKGNKIVISDIDIVVKRTTVYNFEVADYHTYYVSEQQVLVHNSGPCNVDLTQYGQAKHLNGEPGVYEHFYTNKAGNVKSYTGQSKNLGGARPKKSLRERTRMAKAQGYTYSHSRLTPLKGSGHSSLNKLEAAKLKANGGPKGPTFNNNSIPL